MQETRILFIIIAELYLCIGIGYNENVRNRTDSYVVKERTNTILLIENDIYYKKAIKQITLEHFPDWNKGRDKMNYSPPRK